MKNYCIQKLLYLIFSWCVLTKNLELHGFFIQLFHLNFYSVIEVLALFVLVGSAGAAGMRLILTMVLSMQCVIDITSPLSLSVLYSNERNLQSRSPVYFSARTALARFPRSLGPSREVDFQPWLSFGKIDAFLPKSQFAWLRFVDSCFTLWF